MVDAPSILPFDRVTQWTPISSTRFTGHIGQQWLQGRGAFGGVLAGAAVEAMAPMVAKARPLRQIDVRFMAPVAPDEAVVLEVQVLRESKRISHLLATFTQDGATACIVGATFATPRPSERALAPPQRPIDAPAPEDVPDMPFLPGLIPAAMQFFQLRWVSSPPFSGTAHPGCEGWCRLRDGATRGSAAVVALLDAWPPPVLSMLKGPAPAASVTWSAQLSGLPETYPEGWFYYRSEAVDWRDGYVRMRAHMWDPGGGLCASSEQLMAVFA